MNYWGITESYDLDPDMVVPDNKEALYLSVALKVISSDRDADKGLEDRIVEHLSLFCNIDTKVSSLCLCVSLLSEVETYLNSKYSLLRK